MSPTDEDLPVWGNSSCRGPHGHRHHNFSSFVYCGGPTMEVVVELALLMMTGIDDLRSSTEPYPKIEALRACVRHHHLLQMTLVT